MNVTIEKGKTVIVEREDGTILRLTFEEWRELRRIQNLLFVTEPE